MNETFESVSAYAKNDARIIIRTQAKRVLALATEAVKMNEPEKAREYAYTFAWMEAAAEWLAGPDKVDHLSPEMREVIDADG